MKPNRMLSIALIFAAVILADTPLQAKERTVTFRIEKMTCAACPFIVRKSMSAVPGVESVDVSFERKTATVTFDDEKTNTDAIARASTDRGYPAHPVVGDHPSAPEGGH